VAAEFGLVGARKTRLEEMARRGDRSAALARRMIGSLNRYISATQLGITVCGLALGWIGEPALAGLIEAGLARVPVIVKEASPQALLELALVENLQREDLGALEEAGAFRRLAEEFNLTQEAIATRVGRSRSAVANSLRLLSLSSEIQASLARGEITAGHARALLGIDDPAERHSAWLRIVEGGLTVREAETMSKGRARSRPRLLRRPSPDVAALEERLRSSLGTRVDLFKGRKGGKMTVYFFSDEELEAIIEKLS